jgi:hypothetical protein
MGRRGPSQQNRGVALIKLKHALVPIKLPHCKIAFPVHI